MIVYQRPLKKEDFQDIENQKSDKKSELIYFYDNNIAYIITKREDKYYVRKYKIFNNQLLSENIFKTIQQCLKISF